MNITGFSLIELMAAMAIAAILASVALPSYQDSVRRTHRADARILLTTTAQRLERCRTQYGSYDDVSCAVGAAANSEHDYYRLVVARNPDTFLLTATPLGAQVSDRSCAQFSLNELGVRTAANSDGEPSARQCW